MHAHSYSVIGLDCWGNSCPSNAKLTASSESLCSLVLQVSMKHRPVLSCLHTKPFSAPYSVEVMWLCVWILIWMTQFYIEETWSLHTGRNTLSRIYEITTSQWCDISSASALHQASTFISPQNLLHITLNLWILHALGLLDLVYLS